MSIRDVSLGDGPDEPLAVLLMKIQNELAEIAELMQAIEPVFNNAGAQRAKFSGADIAALQGLDLAIQKTRGLADFLTELSSGLPQDWLIDVTTALNVLKLSELQSRLLPSGKDVDADRPRAVGDLDLF